MSTTAAASYAEATAFVKPRPARRISFLALSQWLTWPVAWAYFHARYRLNVSGAEQLRSVSRPFIIVANHVSTTDSFLFRLVLGFGTPHLPLRFMAVNRFDIAWLNKLAKLGVIDALYGLFGVFTVQPGLGLKKNLEKAEELIRHGENLVIYPEGNVNRGETLLPFKQGAAVLALATHCPVLPVSFRIRKTGHGRPALDVRIGKPISDLAGMTSEQATERLSQTVSALFRS